MEKNDLREAAGQLAASSSSPGQGAVALGADEDMAGGAVDFGMAEHFLRQARAALECGNRTEFNAARYMIMLALGK